MAETVDTAPEQPAPRAALVYKLAPVFTTKEKPVCPPFEPGDRSWVEDWYWDFDDPDEEENDGVDRLSALPTEILMMIISHLTPGSLLAFSRTSRLFRSLTFTKRAEPIWRGARRRSGWRDLEAGGMNEIQHAKLVEGRICFVRTFDKPKLPTLTSSPIGLRRGGRSWQQYRRDFSLRTVLCQSCATRLIKEGDAISTEFWHLHPHTFSCCLSTRKKPGGDDVPDGQDSLFYTPEVLDQAAVLYKNEASALARNEALESASLTHVTRRSNFKGQVRRDAAKMTADESALGAAQEVEADWRRRMRADMIIERMTALGWEEEEIYCEGCGYLACDAPWCYQCFDDDFDDDFDNWELSSNEEDSLSELAELLPEDEDARDARILLEIKAERHGDCIPAPHDYADSFLNIDRLLKDDEWDACKDPLIEFAARNKHKRLWREEQEDQRYRREVLTLLFSRLKAVVAPARQGVFVSLATFLRLPSVKPLWQDQEAFDEQELSNKAEPAILRDLFDRVHRDKVRIFDRIVRAHFDDSIALPSFVKTVLECEPIACIDGEPSKGLAPLHAVLTDSDMDPILTRLTSLFRCGLCSVKHTYPAIAIHLVEGHDITNVPAYANVPSEAFRQATEGLLADCGLSEDDSFAFFEKMYGDARFDVTMRTSSGETETSVGETWAHVLSGKSPDELEAGRRKLFSSTDRDIVKIRLSVVHSEQAADSSPA